MIITSYSAERKFSLSYLQGFLHAVACMNVGCNHACYYEVYTIPEAGDALQTFDAYFGPEINRKAEASLGTYKLEELHQREQDLYHSLKRIEITEIEDPQNYLEKLLAKWFIQQEYSPISKHTDTKNNLLSLATEFVDCIKKYSTYTSMHKFEFDDSMIESDFVLLHLQNEYLVIHLGWVD